jgi:hypothetical protein
VTRQITLPLHYEADFNDAAYKATKDTFEIDQAVVPFTLNEDWTLITRTKLPLEALPPKKRPIRIALVCGPLPAPVGNGDCRVRDGLVLKAHEGTRWPRAGLDVTTKRRIFAADLLQEKQRAIQPIYVKVVV